MRIQGYITNKDGAAIDAALSIIDPQGNFISNTFVEAGVNYWIEYDEPYLRQLTIVFTSPGYASVKKTGSELIANGNVIMPPSMPVAALLLASGLIFVSLKNKKRKVGKVTTEELMPFLLIAGAILAFSTIKKILDSLGLGGDPTQPEQANPDSPWKPLYWKQFSSYSYAIDLATATDYAETIHDAFTLFQDDYNAILSVFSKMKTKANVSYLCYVFNNKYNEDLLSFLEDGGGVLPWDGLSTAHLNTIISLVNKLPTN